MSNVKGSIAEVKFFTGVMSNRYSTVIRKCPIFLYGELFIIRARGISYRDFTRLQGPFVLVVYFYTKKL